MGDESGVEIGGRARNQAARLMRRLLAILLCHILAGLVVAQKEDKAGLEVRLLSNTPRIGEVSAMLRNTSFFMLLNHTHAMVGYFE